MTTFKNNAKYAELLFTYLDVAIREDTPLTVPGVLRIFPWMFKGGSLRDAASLSLYPLATSATVYPEGLSSDIAREWPEGKQARALRQILVERARDGKMRLRSVLARLGTYKVIVSGLGVLAEPPVVYSGMKAIYHAFGQVWEWAKRPGLTKGWTDLKTFTQELLVGMAAVSRVHVPTADECRETYQSLLERSRVRGLLEAIKQVKNLIFQATGAIARAIARKSGIEERNTWGIYVAPEQMVGRAMNDEQERTPFIKVEVGPLSFRVTQGVAVSGAGKYRIALSQCDMERLHQVLMSTASCLVGVCSQACVGTLKQRTSAQQGIQVAERNVERVVKSARLVPLGDEVLVCKGYRRAYTAMLATLAGSLCVKEAAVLLQEAKETAPSGVLDIDGFMWDAMRLDAATALNAAKVFKICPAPDVSPGGAMIDRILTIGQGNKMDPEIAPAFEAELRSQILRAYIRTTKRRLPFRSGVKKPMWHNEYLMGHYDSVPSMEIDKHLAWENTGVMPELSEYDTSNWKDSGLGADTVRETQQPGGMGNKSNMLTRLLYDANIPLPGKETLSAEHPIKFFVKAEGHKDPARGIFSANLTDRFAQSWMEKAVDNVARNHPSYMIGQEVDEREAKVRQLTKRPTTQNNVALYYSFDISGWSAKMPAEPQRISHKIWSDLYGGTLFKRAHEINEGAHVYLDIEGYKGWYKNTHSNLEGFNGKEMTMVLVALLSLSVRRWRDAAVKAGVMGRMEADATTALLFAYIDDGLSRIDLPASKAEVAFELYKDTVIDTFSRCGFTVEVSKCFPSDRFSIFLNEVYLAGRHVVHGVRAAMGISAEPTERHTSLVERVTSVTTGVRGAVMAGLNPLSAGILMAYHTYMHLMEWVGSVEKDPVILAGWCICPRAWGGLGMPSMLQLFVSGSGSAFEESTGTMQAFGRVSDPTKRAFLTLCRTPLEPRTATSVLTSPLSGRITAGYMVDSRVSVAVRKALVEQARGSKLSEYARRLIRYADSGAFEAFAKAVVPIGVKEVLQEQMLVNLCEAHPHSVFSEFSRRLEKSVTLRNVIGVGAFASMIRANRSDAKTSVMTYRSRTY